MSENKGSKTAQILDKDRNFLYNYNVMLDKNYDINIRDLARGIIDEFPVQEQIKIELNRPIEQPAIAALNGLFKRTFDKVMLKIEVKIFANTTCDRCLEPADFQYSFDMEREIDDLLSFDLKQEVQQEAILQEPFQVLCDEKCKGLCDQCGKNLNLGECRCKEKEKASPFDVLEELF